MLRSKRYSIPAYSSLGIVLIGASFLIGCSQGPSMDEYQTIDLESLPSDQSEPAETLENEQTPSDTTENPAVAATVVSAPEAVGENDTAINAESVAENTVADEQSNADPTAQPLRQPTPEEIAKRASVEPGKILANDPVVEEKKSVGPREVKLLVPQKTFKAEGPDDALRVSYDDFDLLKVLNMDPVPVDAPKAFPKWLKELEGKRVRVRGFMYPPFEETGLKAFVLARDNQICCFGRNPKVYDLVEISMRRGETANYIQNRPFDVVGVFHIDPIADEGELFGLYRIDDAVVIDK